MQCSGSKHVSGDTIQGLTLLEGTSPAELIDGTNKINAATGNSVRPGYKLCVKLPEQTLAGEASRQCTLSLLDQRNWGGCLDLTLKEASPTPPPTPAPTQELSAALEAASGVYQTQACVQSDDCKLTTCCMTANAMSTSSGGMAIKVRASRGCDSQFNEWNKDPILTMLNPDPVFGGKVLSGSFKVRVKSSGNDEAALQPFTIAVTGGDEISILNDAVDTPLICDQAGTYAMNNAQAISAGLFTSAEEEMALDFDGDTGGMGGFAKFMLVALAGVAVYAGLVAFSIVPKPAFLESSSAQGGSDAPPPLPPKMVANPASELPPGWESHVDPESGDVYYHNTADGTTTWDKPTTGITKL